VINFHSVWGPTSDDLWAVADLGVIFHWDGAHWTRISSGDTNNFQKVRGCGGGAEAWIASTGSAVLHWNGILWQRVATPSPDSYTLFGAACTGPNDAWVVGHDDNNPPFAMSILHWDGAAFSVSALYPPDGGMTSGQLFDVWASAPNDVWAVGQGNVILHYSGSSWSTVVGAGATGALNALWGSAADDVWAVGNSGVILHWDGGTWASSGFNGTNDLSSVWGTARNDVWASGSGPVLLHWDGVSWTPTTFPTDSQFQPLAIWAGTDRIWAIGYGGHFFTYSR
jgi:hypothetical protein